jgi:hypothetical protein
VSRRSSPVSALASHISTTLLGRPSPRKSPSDSKAIQRPSALMTGAKGCPATGPAPRPIPASSGGILPRLFPRGKSLGRRKARPRSPGPLPSGKATRLAVGADAGVRSAGKAREAQRGPRSSGDVKAPVVNVGEPYLHRVVGPALAQENPHRNGMYYPMRPSALIAGAKALRSEFWPTARSRVHVSQATQRRILFHRCY